MTPDLILSSILATSRARGIPGVSLQDTRAAFFGAFVVPLYLLRSRGAARPISTRTKTLELLIRGTNPPFLDSWNAPPGHFPVK